MTAGARPVLDHPLQAQRPWFGEPVVRHQARALLASGMRSALAGGPGVAVEVLAAMPTDPRIRLGPGPVDAPRVDCHGPLGASGVNLCRPATVPRQGWLSVLPAPAWPRRLHRTDRSVSALGHGRGASCLIWAARGRCWWTVVPAWETSCPRRGRCDVGHPRASGLGPCRGGRCLSLGVGPCQARADTLGDPALLPGRSPGGPLAAL